MIAPLYAAALFCESPKLKDDTNTPWTQTDQEYLVQVQKEGCKKANPDEPCLYVFVKVGDKQYEAVCGPEQRRPDE